MTEAIGPGTILVCINGSMPPGELFGSTCEVLTEGAIYTCREVISDPDSKPCPWDECGSTGITLEQKFCDCYQVHWAFCPNLFRPLNDGDTSLVDEEFERKVERLDYVSTHLPDLEKLNV